MSVLCMHLQIECLHGDWPVLMSLLLLQKPVLDVWTAVAAKGSKLGMDLERLSIKASIHGARKAAFTARV